MWFHRWVVPMVTTNSCSNSRFSLFSVQWVRSPAAFLPAVSHPSMTFFYSSSSFAFMCPLGWARSLFNDEYSDMVILFNCYGSLHSVTTPTPPRTISFFPPFWCFYHRVLVCWGLILKNFATSLFILPCYLSLITWSRSTCCTSFFTLWTSIIPIGGAYYVVIITVFRCSSNSKTGKKKSNNEDNVPTAPWKYVNPRTVQNEPSFAREWAM